MKLSKCLVSIVIAAAYSLSAFGANPTQGSGAVLKEDAWSVKDVDGKEPEYHLRQGTLVAFLAMSGDWGDRRVKNGYCKVAFFIDNEGKGKEISTWVPDDKLEVFFYPCTPRDSGGLWYGSQACVPVQGFTKHHWSYEFKAAARGTFKKLGFSAAKGSVIVGDPAAEPAVAATEPAQPPSATAAAARPAPPSMNDPALKNSDVIAMSQAGLATDIILAKIRASAVDFDVSINGLVELQNAKINPDVIKAMIDRPKGPPQR